MFTETNSAACTATGQSPWRLRWRLGRASLWALGQVFVVAVASVASPAQAAGLVIDDGVVVKFATGTALVIRDAASFGSSVTLTSLADDTQAGQTGAAAGAAKAGDWLGLRVETSTAGLGGATLGGLQIRFAGAADGSGQSAQLTLRGVSPVLQGLRLGDGAGSGLRLMAGAAPSISASSFERNAVGLASDGTGAPAITASQFVGNSAYGVSNAELSNVVQATGNWWGDASGPKQLVSNPLGLGNAVTSGVNYGAYLNKAPLLQPWVQRVMPATYDEVHEIVLRLSCLNATRYRMSESQDFSGSSWKSLPGGAGQVIHVASPGDGRKAVYVQFGDDAGQVKSTSLADGLLIDTQAPQVGIIKPLAGSVIGQAFTVEASASDVSGVAQVQFKVNDQLVATQPPAASNSYRFVWDNSASADGPYALGITAVDIAGRSTSSVVTVTWRKGAPPPDNEGPLLSAFAIGGLPLTNGTVINRSASLSFNATDASGVARVDLLVDGQVLASTSSSNADAFVLPLAIQSIASGPHALVLRAFDSLNNSSTTSFNITIGHAAPDAPVILDPVNGVTVRDPNLAISGRTSPSSSVRVLLDGLAAGQAITTGVDGRFSANVTLHTGVNLLAADASDENGHSPASASVKVTLDTSVPLAPTALVAQGQAGGKIKLSWTKSTDANALGQDLYRAGSPFDAAGQAAKVNATPLTGNSYEDMPPDGSWFYRVVAVNAAGTLSVPSNQAQALADSILPRAVSIAYAPQGKVDASTGRIGQGLVNLVLTVSEPLMSTPYLAIVPAGGAPITVELLPAGSNRYNGSFVVDAGTPSGTAHALFSARDGVGNRGSDIDAGATLLIDTAGPVLAAIALTPASPIKNDGTPALQSTFTFNKAVKAGTTPQVSYRLSGPLRAPVALALTQVDLNTWQSTFKLPADGGLAGPETLSFSVKAFDDLDNLSTKVGASNRYQVYQGNLPPLGVPLSFVAKALPGGKVRLTWQAVDDALLYQIYRQPPGQPDLQPWVRTTGSDYIDTTPTDGSYVYAVASVRQASGQEAVSGLSPSATVQASATAPGAPQSLTLGLTGQGIAAQWQPPLFSPVASYNLYRSSGLSIASIAGLQPYKTGLKQPSTVDANPDPTRSAYVVTALDAAGNESALSNSAYLNAALLPVRNLKVVLQPGQLPELSWDAPNGSIAGYLVYVGEDNALTRLTASPVTGTRLTDTGYTAVERRYTVAAVDAAGLEARSVLVLPSVNAQVVSGAPILRGIMNRLQVQVSNTSSGFTGARVVVAVPTDSQGTQFKTHRSDVFALGANQTQLIPIVVGGYAQMPGRVQAQIGVELVPAEGQLVSVSRTQSIDVGDGSLTIGISTQDFTRGATGQVKLTVENNTDVDLELLTATGNGGADSTELRFKLLDNDGNVLATQAYRQALGAAVVTLANGQTVARLPAGTKYVSDAFSVNVPSAAPNAVRLQLEVDKLRHHSGEADEIAIEGRGAERSVSLLDTAYFGEVTDATPLSSFGDEDVVITGRALDRATGQALPNTRLKLVLNQQGFERNFSVITGASGSFRYSFAPTATDSGFYKVSAVHPDVSDRPEQKSFTIKRITVGPTPYKLDLPKNMAFTIPLTAKAGAGTSASNLRLAYEAAAQPTGQLPTGVTLQLPGAVGLAERQTLNLPVIFNAVDSAQPSGSLILTAYSDDRPGAPIGQVRIDYALSEAKPFLVSTPSFVETGLAQGGSQIESVLVENKGLQDAQNLTFSLAKPDNSPAPAWMTLSSNADGSIAVGGKRPVDLRFAPPADTPSGVYEARLVVQGDNIPKQTLNVFASVTQSGQGGVLFKAADIYTATVDKNGLLVPGLAGATVTLQNEDVSTINLQLLTDSQGEALFQGLPAGSYKFRASASNHQELGGRLTIKPGVTVNQPVFLDYTVITVEWSVREIAIQDRYEITLNATFETTVPAPVVVLEPAAINLPKMNTGDVFHGTLSLTNYGLVTAEDVKQKLPTSDAYFRYEFLVDVPDTLNAKQRVTIPYRVIALQSLEQAASTPNASGGGCYNYSTVASIGYGFRCANGTRSSGSASASWFAVSSSSCSGGPGGPGGIAGGGGGGGGGGGIGGFGSGGGFSTSLPLRGGRCVFIPDTKTFSCQK